MTEIRFPFPLDAILVTDRETFVFGYVLGFDAETEQYNLQIKDKGYEHLVGQLIVFDDVYVDYRALERLYSYFKERSK